MLEGISIVFGRQYANKFAKLTNNGKRRVKYENAVDLQYDYDYGDVGVAQIC